VARGSEVNDRMRHRCAECCFLTKKNGLPYCQRHYRHECYREPESLQITLYNNELCDFAPKIVNERKKNKMTGYKDYDNKAIERLLNFVYPDESKLLDKEVAEELIRLNIDTTEAMNKIKQVIKRERNDN
jgi:uncharacterized protein YwgA